MLSFLLRIESQLRFRNFRYKFINIFLANDELGEEEEDDEGEDEGEEEILVNHFGSRIVDFLGVSLRRVDLLGIINGFHIPK